MLKEKLLNLLKSGRKYIGGVIILLTIGAFYAYLRANPDALEPLKSAPLYIIPLILVLYGLMLFTNFLVTVVTIAMNDKQYPAMDSLMLTIYSTLVNFFGPLQSGPGFRAVYLKKKIGLSIKGYTLATMLYYGSFAAISLAMMFGTIKPYITLALLVALAGCAAFVFRKYEITSLIKNGLIIGVVTLVQLSIVALIYYIELRATGYQPSLSSTLIYAGSANFALFVSFTPGAIGIRESFLYLSQSLHGIPTENIVSASLLDRAIYIVFLGILFLVSSGMHLNKRLRTAK